MTTATKKDTDARSARYMTRTNIIRPGRDMIPKGRVLPLRDFDGCDMSHLIKTDSVRPWGGNNGKASDLLLRCDNPTPEQYQEEIARLQEELESAEARLDSLENKPAAPARLPLLDHVNAETIAELQGKADQDAETIRRLTKSLKDAQHDRDAARERADDYLERLKAFEVSSEPLVLELEPVGDDVGNPAPSIKEPIPSVSKRYLEHKEEELSAVADSIIGLTEVTNTGPGGPIRSTTKAM